MLKFILVFAHFMSPGVQVVEFDTAAQCIIARENARTIDAGATCYEEAQNDL